MLRKKTLAWILTLVMVISLAPATVWAEEEAQPDTAVVSEVDEAVAGEAEAEPQAQPEAEAEPASEISEETEAVNEASVEGDASIVDDSAVETLEEGATSEEIADEGAETGVPEDTDEETMASIKGAAASSQMYWADLQYDFNDGKTIILTSDVTPQFSNETDPLVVPAGKIVTLDLNGFTINRGRSANDIHGTITSTGNVITVKGTLVLRDSSAAQTGKITGGYSSSSDSAGGILVDGGSLVMYGGTISGNGNLLSVGSGGGVHVKGGSFSFEGGSIENNIVGSSGAGVCIRENGSFTMKDPAKIISNRCSGTPTGGGIYVYSGTAVIDGGYINNNQGEGVYILTNGTVTMNDGQISGNSSSGVSQFAYGGSFTMNGGTINNNGGTGVVQGSSGSVTLNGGSITNNNGRGVSIGYNNSITISGNPIIKNNSEYDTENNVFFNVNQDAPEDTPIPIVVSNPLGEDASIGITLGLFYGQAPVVEPGKPFVFTSGLSSNGNTSAFFSDNSDYVISWDKTGTEAALAVPGIYHTVTWKNWDGTVLETDIGVEDGTEPVYNGETPTRPADENPAYKYTFSGWDPEVSTITGDTVYTAQFEITNKCGENLAWNIDNNVLRITGTGNMWNYSLVNLPDWHDKSFAEVQIGAGVTGIGEYAFYASQINRVSISNTVTTIGAGAFAFCTNLYGVSIPDSVVTIGNQAFWRCDRLTTVIIGNSVTTIGEQAFALCPYLTSVNIPNGVTSIGKGAFQQSGLTSIVIPDSVTEIDERVFYACTSLASVTIPKTVTMIGDNAFNGCSALADVYYSGTEVDWAAISIGTGNEKLLQATLHALSVYTVTWKNWNGLVLETDENVVEGTMPSYDGATPTRPASEDYEYTFSGWSPEISEVSEDIVYTAQYDQLGKCGDNLTWTLIDGVLTINGTGAMKSYNEGSGRAPWYGSVKEVSLPEGLTSIGSYAFENCQQLTEITIPEGVTIIDVYAFSGCTALQSITLPCSVDVNLYAGKDCSSLTTLHLTKGTGIMHDNSIELLLSTGRSSLKTLILDNGITAIERYAFRNCTQLENITLPEDLETIEYKAFDSCSSVQEIHIPVSVTSIEAEAFYGWSSLTDVYYDGTRAEWNAINIGTDNDPLQQARLHTTESELVLEEGEELLIPYSAGTNTVRATFVPETNGYYNFTYIPGANMSISRASVISEEKATEEQPYYVNYNVASMTYGYTALADVYLTAGKTYYYEVEYTASEPESNEDYLMMKVEKSTNDRSCGENDVHWDLTEDGVLTISGTGAMRDYNWDNYMRYQPWQYKIVKQIVIDSGVTTIGDFAFYPFDEYRTLESVSIPNSVTSIGSAAFEYCTLLANVMIPESVTTIGDSAFLGCNSLKRANIPSSITTISDHVFMGCESLEDVIIPNSVTRIGLQTFQGCASFENVVIPDSVTRIDQYAFADCDSLVSVIIGNHVDTIGWGAFQWCSSLESVTIPGSVIYINSYAFADCPSLTSVIIPNSVTTLDSAVFSNCTSLESVTLPDSVNMISENMFYNCSSLVNVILPDSVTTIGQYAFWNGISLSNINIPKAVTAIDNYAFDGCSSLSDVYYDDSPNAWAAITISEHNDPLLNAMIHYTVYNAAYAEEFIDAIPAIDELTLDDMATVEAARAAYNKISAEEQALVAPEKLAKLVAAEARIQELYDAEYPPYIVTVTSVGEGISSTIAPVYGGGTYRKGDSVTVGATNVSGFAFQGWYIDSELVSDKYEYTFTLEGDTALKAVYQAIESTTFTLKITGVDFKVNGIPQNYVYTEKFEIGTEVALEYYGYDQFLRWENASNLPYSTNRSLTLTMNRSYELKVVSVRSIAGSEESGYYAFVEFVSPYDQVMSASTWSSKDDYTAHTLPRGASKSGYSFVGWTMDGVNAAGAKDIINAINADTSYIKLTALQEEMDAPRTVTVYDVNGNTTEQEVNLGKNVSLKAGTVSGKTFKCWALDPEGTTPLSYNSSYTFKVTTDISVYAIYVNAGESVTPQPVVNTTGVYAETKETGDYLCFMENHDVPSGYTVEEYGILYGTKVSEFPDAATAEAKLFYDSENPYVLRAISPYTLKRDSFDLQFVVTGHRDNYVYTRSYLVVTNDATGEKEVYYGQFRYGTYNMLLGAEG